MRSRSLRFLLASSGVVAVLGVAVLLLHCGGAVCGNGVKETGEQCDNGAQNGMTGSNCSATCTGVSIPRASLQVSYSRLNVTSDGYTNYPAPTCNDLGIANAQIVIAGPMPDTKLVPCSQTSATWDPITPGMYQATITLLDAQGVALTKPRTSLMTDVQIGTPTVISLDFAEADYLKSYKGTLYLVPSWGTVGTQCATASVTQEGLRLVKSGTNTPVAGMTVGGRKLDGTLASCFSPSAGTSFERIDNLPWGAYDLAVLGYQGGTLSHCGLFHVFVGIGIATPTLQLASVTSDPDAGACP